MDLQSLWLTNQSLFENLNDDEYKFKEKEIESFFGGTRNMATLILKNKHNLSYIEQNQFLKILKKPIPKEISNKNDIVTASAVTTQDLKTKDGNQSVTLSKLNQHCLSHIFQLLDSGDATAFSYTSRNICIVAAMKKSRPNSDVMQFPMQKLYHFIHKISELNDTNENENNLLKFMDETELLCVWIKNEYDIYKPNAMRLANMMAESGILLIYSDLLTNKTIINNHSKLIKNILFLVKTLSLNNSHVSHLINVNIIENLTLLTQTIMDTHKMTDHEIIPQIVCIYANLFFSDNAFQFAIRTKIFQSQIILEIAYIFGKKWVTEQKMDLFWIRAGLSLIREWFCYFQFVDNCFGDICDEQDFFQMVHRVQYVIHQFVKKISNLIDVKYSYEWVYQLLAEGHMVVVRDPNDFINNETNEDDHDSNYFYTFSIAEIVKLPLRSVNVNAYDPPPMITLIGKFNHYDVMNPNQKITVPLDHIHCMETEDPYHNLMRAFQSLCNLQLYVKNYICNKMDFKSNKYNKIANEIKHILDTSRTQFPRYTKKDILLTLLNTNWQFFIQFISNEIQTEFVGADGSAIYSLMEVAWNCNNLSDLCQLEWFRTQFDRPQFVMFMNMCEFGVPFPECWDQRIYIEILKNFYDANETYLQLLIFAVLTEMNSQWVHNDDTGMRQDFVLNFINSNGVYWLLTISVNAFKKNRDSSVGRSGVVSIRLMTKCIDILSAIFMDLPSALFLRKECLKLFDDTTGIAEENTVIKILWWLILKRVFTENMGDENHMKLILVEINWFLDQYDGVQSIDNNNDIRDVLLELQTQQFTDKDITTYLQNIISYIQ